MKLHGSLAVLLLLGSAWRQTTEFPKGVIEGHVVSAATGEAVSDARIRLSVVADPGSPDYLRIPRTFAGVTDAKGNFVFEGLAPNKYFLSAEIEDYVRQAYGPFELGVERGVGDIVVRIKQAAVVTGHIVSGTGPLEGIEVILVQGSYDGNGRKAFVSLQNARTDDRGEYRLFGIQPGSYYLMARAPSTESLSRLTGLVPGLPFPQETLRKYGALYYPGTAEFSAASALELKPGTEAKAIDFVMSEQPTYRVRGRVVDAATGNPGSASIGIFARNGVGITGSSFDTPSPGGTFEIRNVPPGEHVLVGILSGANPSTPNEEPGRIISVPVDVAGADVENVVLTFAPLAHIRGRLSVEGQAQPNLVGLDSFQCLLVKVKGGAGIPIPARLVRTHSAPAADGSFLYDGVIPDEYELRFGGLPGNFYVKEATYGAVNVLVNPMKISGDQDSLRIVVSPNGGQIEGTLRDSNMQPIRNADVSLIPDDRSRLGLYRRVLTDGTGHFMIRGLAPGDYKLFAWEDAPDNAHYDPEFVHTSEDKGIAVQVVEFSKVTRDVPRIAPVRE